MKAKFKIGDKVCMKDDVAHIALPEFYPDCTVIGEVMEMYSNKLYVNWGEDSGTSGNHAWFVEKNCVVKEEE